MKKIFVLMLGLLILLYGCQNQNPAVRDGQWYCDELKIYVDLDNRSDDYSVHYIDEEYAERVICYAEILWSSLEITLYEVEHYKYDYMHMFFDGTITTVKDDYFTVKETKTGKIYTFDRVEKMPELDITPTTGMLGKLEQLDISLTNGTISDYGIPEMDATIFSSLTRAKTSMEQVKQFADIHYLKQIENRFFTVVKTVENGESKMFYIEFLWDLTYNQHWEIRYSEYAQKEDLDGITAGMFQDDVKEIDPQGKYSIDGKVRDDCFSYHMVKDRDGKGYGYWIRYEDNTSNSEVKEISRIDAF